MAKQDVTQRDERLENVEEALSKTELWIENNQKILWAILIALLLVALGIFGITKYKQKRNETASKLIYKAQEYFGNEQYDMALNGDGNHVGLLDIVNSYGSTKTGKLASYYAGIAYLKQGNYKEAIEYLKKYNTNDQVLAPMALGAIGDCYMELEDLQNAASYYGKAAAKNPNDFTSPLFLAKQGNTYEMIGDYAKALQAYKTLKKDFPLSNEAFEINKNIANMEEKLKK
ncbi:MAG: tetratricopeptide repeat protein [Bacteroidales bacterium]|nr:tetratricopeptide repeat protein [Bacteroidales bacterium]